MAGISVNNLFIDFLQESYPKKDINEVSRIIEELVAKINC